VEGGGGDEIGVYKGNQALIDGEIDLIHMAGQRCGKKGVILARTSR
jgi:hypothetical protein